jgi:hypothetical protein
VRRMSRVLRDGKFAEVIVAAAQLERLPRLEIVNEHPATY